MLLPLGSALFPYTTLFRSHPGAGPRGRRAPGGGAAGRRGGGRGDPQGGPLPQPVAEARPADLLDRKSTRLNSSHVKNSYAVYCLKKKNKNDRRKATLPI